MDDAERCYIPSDEFYPKILTLAQASQVRAAQAHDAELALIAHIQAKLNEAILSEYKVLKYGFDHHFALCVLEYEFTPQVTEYVKSTVIANCLASGFFCQFTFNEAAHPEYSYYSITVSEEDWILDKEPAPPSAAPQKGQSWLSSFFHKSSV